MDDLATNGRGSLTTYQLYMLAQHIATGNWSSLLDMLVFLGSAAFFCTGARFRTRFLSLGACRLGAKGQTIFFNTIYRKIVILILFTASIIGCNSVQSQTKAASTPVISATTPILPTGPVSPTITSGQPSPTLALSDFAFPDSIDPVKLYMFYLHGKIIEDQGIPAISPDYGEYEYLSILEKLSGYGFVVISEQRPKNTESGAYARKIAAQVTNLLNAGVPAKNITVVGASKGAGITILISHILENEEINFVIMAICDPVTVRELIQDQIALYANVLSIYDSSDELAGTCQDLFSFSEGKGIARYDEIILNTGTGHGILFKPLDEWIKPTVQWAGKP